MKKNQDIIPELINLVQKISRFKVVLFCLIVAAIYGATIFTIGNLLTVEPNADDVSSGSQTAKVPHIDPGLIQQLKSLQDNSVNVKTLFNNARSNPFQE